MRNESRRSPVTRNKGRQLSAYNANGNTFFSLLQDVNRLHVQIADRYEILLMELKRTGVAFGDIKNRLLKEAKRAGLYRKSVVKDGGMDYPTQTSLRDSGVAWFHDMSLFLQWVKRNYSDYGVKIPKKQKLMYKAVDKKKSTAIVRRTTDESGEVVETRTDIVGASSSQEVVEGSGITKPIEADLSLAQKQALIIRNFSVLGGIAQEKGPEALEAFNVLMLSLGLDDEIIKDDEFANEDVSLEVRPQILGNEAPINGPFAGSFNPTVPVQH